MVNTRKDFFLVDVVSSGILNNKYELLTRELFYYVCLWTNVSYAYNLILHLINCKREVTLYFDGNLKSSLVSSHK